MKAYQMRLIEEYQELDDRIQKLGNYLMQWASSPREVTAQGLSDFRLLFRQLRVMTEYKQILYTRLNAMHLDPCSSYPTDEVRDDADTV